MSFTALRNSLERQTDTLNSKEAYLKNYLKDEILSHINQLNNSYIEYLYVDLIKAESKLNIKSFLDDFYGSSNELAKECLTIALHVNHLYGYKIRSWTDFSLHAFDRFLVQLINKRFNTQIPKRPVYNQYEKSKIYETDIYNFLENQEFPYNEIGSAFNIIYKQRNEFTHVQYEDQEDGRRKFRVWNSKKFNQALELILKQFQRALQYFDDLKNL